MMVETDDGDGRPGILNVDTGEVSVLDPVVANVRYVGSGHLLYLKDTAMMAVPFDVRSGRVTGAEVAVLSGVSIAGNYSAAVAFSDSGVLAYSIGPLAGSRWAPSTLVRITNGTVTPLPFDAEYIRSMKASADGNLLAVGTPDFSTWIYDLRRQTRTRLPEAGVRYRLSGPVWSPDNSRVAFFSAMVGWHLYRSLWMVSRLRKWCCEAPRKKRLPCSRHTAGSLCSHSRAEKHRRNASGPIPSGRHWTTRASDEVPVYGNQSRVLARRQMAGLLGERHRPARSVCAAVS